MKRIVLTIAFCFILSACFAQQLKSATLVKVNSATLKVYGLKFQSNRITYYLFPSAKAKRISTPRSEISRIKYATGQEEIIEIKPFPISIIQTAFTKGNIPFPVSSQQANKGPRPDRIYKKDRGIIECRIIESGPKEIKYIVLTDKTQRVRTIKRNEIERVEHNMVKDNPVVAREVPKPAPKREPLVKRVEKAPVIKKKQKTIESHFDVTLIANGAYMLGSDQWINPVDGFGHLAGWGASLLSEYHINKKMAIGIKIGYARWRTNVNFKPDSEGPVFKQHINELSQVPIFGTFRIYLGNYFYLIPEGGLSFTTVKINQIGIKDSFTKVQTGYGLNIGYAALINERLTYDISGFYRTYFAKSLDPMKYIGIQFSVKLSLK